MRLKHRSRWFWQEPFYPFSFISKRNAGAMNHGEIALILLCINNILFHLFIYGKLEEYRTSLPSSPFIIYPQPINFCCCRINKLLYYWCQKSAWHSPSFWQCCEKSCIWLQEKTRVLTFSGIQMCRPIPNGNPLILFTAFINWIPTAFFF